MEFETLKSKTELTRKEWESLIDNEGNIDAYGFAIETLKNMPEEVKGGLYLRECTRLTSLKGCAQTIGGWLDLDRCTGLTSLEGCPHTIGGGLDLKGCTGLTSLKGCAQTIGDWLDLSGCTGLTSLEGCPHTIGGGLDLTGCTGLTNLEGCPHTIGGWLFLIGCTGLTSLAGCPQTIGDWLDLSGCTGLTSLEGCPHTIGGGLDLTGCTGITNIHKRMYKPRKLKDGDYVPGDYIYADGILTLVNGTMRSGKYTIYLGKIPGKNVITDGEHYAHCKTVADGVADLAFKAAKDRGSEQYNEVTLDTVMSASDMITMYRIITGACQAGTAAFVERLGQLRETYSVREAIEITKGQYQAEAFKKFFEK